MENQEFYVVLGLDAQKKPHAARFNIADEATVSKTAGSKGFQIGVPKTKEAVETAAKLIEGKIFDSGRGLVPFVSADIYSKLIKLLELKDVVAPKGDPSPTTKPGQGLVPDPWASLKVGSVVLAREQDPGPDKSWWEARIESFSPDRKTAICSWAKYPKEPKFRARIPGDVAVLPSKR